MKIPFRMPIRIPILRIPIWGRTWQPTPPVVLAFLHPLLLSRGWLPLPSPFFFWGSLSFLSSFPEGVAATPSSCSLYLGGGPGCALPFVFLSGGRAGPPPNSFLGFLLVVFQGETCIPPLLSLAFFLSWGADCSHSFTSFFMGGSWLRLFLFLSFWGRVLAIPFISSFCLSFWGWPFFLGCRSLPERQQEKNQEGIRGRASPPP